MKKIFSVFALFAGIICANAQDDIEKRCLSELSPIIAKAKAVWHEGNTYYGIGPERSKQYATYCLEACAICDKYINLITDENTQIDLLWGQVDILSDVLKIYEDHKWGLNAIEYEKQFQRKVTSLNNILAISNRIDNEHDNLQVKFDVNYNLGKHYFKCAAYEKASLSYSICIETYQKLIKGNMDDDEFIKFGQEVYYYMGYTAYKLGDNLNAQNYFNKAKNILNDDLIQPYK